jgi:CRISPR-associated protein Csb1
MTTHTPKEVTERVLDSWATDSDGPVALHLKQRLVPIEGDGAVVYPPTYADIGYNIDRMCDGKMVATIDSAGAQANRMEPIFKAVNEPLVPQVSVVLRNGVSLSLLDLAHRAADAVVYAAPSLSNLIESAFKKLGDGDAEPMCRIAPTSLVFGVWDSRPERTGEKRPRIVRSIIRAWDVQPFHSAAQFNSIWKHLDDEQREVLTTESKGQKKLSAAGLADAPAVFRKLGPNAAKKMPAYRDGSPNPEVRVLGGVLTNGRIERDVTVNLVALRGLRGASDDGTAHVRKYLLGLSLLAATADIDLYLREGCHLRYSGDDVWNEVPRRGDPTRTKLAEAREVIAKYAAREAEYFKKSWPAQSEHRFDLGAAKKLLTATTEEDAEPE